MITIGQARCRARATWATLTHRLVLQAVSFEESEHFFQREFDDSGAGIRGSVIDQDGVVLVNDSGGENDIRDKTLALEIGFGDVHISPGRKNSIWGVQVHQ